MFTTVFEDGHIVLKNNDGSTKILDIGLEPLHFELNSKGNRFCVSYRVGEDIMLREYETAVEKFYEHGKIKSEKSFSYSYDSTYLIIGRDNTIDILKGRKPYYKKSDIEGYKSFCVGNKSNVIAILFDNFIYIYSIKTTAELVKINSVDLLIDRIKFSSDDLLIAGLNSINSRITIFNIRANSRNYLIPTLVVKYDSPIDIIFSKVENTAVVCYRNSCIRVWNLVTHEVIVEEFTRDKIIGLYNGSNENNYIYIDECGRLTEIDMLTNTVYNFESDVKYTRVKKIN